MTPTQESPYVRICVKYVETIAVDESEVSDVSDGGDLDEHSAVGDVMHHGGQRDGDHRVPDDRVEANQKCMGAVEYKTTSNRHDDWLHRGPFLAELPWHIYIYI